MTAGMTPFLRMNGLGNTFLVVDARRGGRRPAPDILRRLADPTSGPGFDQFITIEDGREADAFMRIDNADGGEVEACGNAARCVAHLLMEEKAADKVTIDTRGGRLTAIPGEAPLTVTVDMGRPRFHWTEIPLAEEFRDTRMIELQAGPIDAPVLHSPSVVNVGNPHAIFWVKDVKAHALDRIGPILENHPIFPQRANISLAEILAPDAIRLATWERGAGLTRACGTAACAALVCAARTGRTGREATVQLPGGDLCIRWAGDDHIWMSGPLAYEYRGLFEPDSGAWSREESQAE